MNDCDILDIVKEQHDHAQDELFRAAREAGKGADYALYQIAYRAGWGFVSQFAYTAAHSTKGDVAHLLRIVEQAALALGPGSPAHKGGEDAYLVLEGRLRTGN